MGDRVCAGEWTKCERWSAGDIHGRLGALALVSRQRRSRVCRWLWQSSYSTADRTTTATARHCWHRLSSQAVAANTTILQWPNITAIRCTPQCTTDCIIHWAWRYLTIASTMSVRLLSVWSMLILNSLHSASEYPACHLILTSVSLDLLWRPVQQPTV